MKVHRSIWVLIGFVLVIAALVLLVLNNPDAVPFSRALVSEEPAGTETVSTETVSAEPVSAEPEPVNEEPAPASEEPAAADEEPAPASEEPVAVNEEPASANEEPATVDEEPVGKQYEEASVAAAILGLQASFPEGMRYTNEDEYYWKGYTPSEGIIWNRGYGCAAFAFYASDLVFDADPAYFLKDNDQVRTGDIMRIYEFDDDPENDHSVIVTGLSSAGITVAEANFDETMHWGRTFPWSILDSEVSYIISRYPVKWTGTHRPEENSDQGVDESILFGEAAKLVELINAERTKAGLSALRVSAELRSFAEVRATEISTEGNYGYLRPDGSGAISMMNENRVSYHAFNELIGSGFNTAEAMLADWMASGMGASFTSSLYSRIGVSCHQAGGVLYWDILFAS